MSLPAQPATPIHHTPPPRPPNLTSNSSPAYPTFSTLPRKPPETITFTSTNSNSKPKPFSYKQKHRQIDPEVLKWTSSIARHCQNGNLSEAVKEFTRMRLTGCEPNHVTFVALLSGCAHFPSKIPSLGTAIHAYARKLGSATQNVKVGTALIDMYSKKNLVEYAGMCFNELSVKNSLTWNTMIDGLMRNGKIEDAIMLFDEMPARDVISWTALINGFVKRGLYEEALEWFCQMQLSGVEPDYVTTVAVISACANVGALSLALWINRFVMEQNFRKNVRVANSLIDMYARCGCIEYARHIFHNMPAHTLVSWNSMINGFAVNGLVDEALECFEMMLKGGFQPDGVSFTGVLSACSHAGLVDKGLNYFDDMQITYGISPRIEHYGCIVDLYGRAGRLKDALDVIKRMPMKANEIVLGSLLAACRSCGDLSLAEALMNSLFQLDPTTDSNYVLLANMYAGIGSWGEASRVRRKMSSHGIQKRPGISSIEIDGKILQFVAGDLSHDETDSIYALLDLLSFEMGMCGYVPEMTVSTIA